MKISVNTRKLKIVTLLLLLVCCSSLYGQTITYSWFYRVYFKDKGENSINNFLPQNLLSQRAIDRREKYGIPYPDFRDIPVSSAYINTISLKGLKLHSTSKWMNSGLFKSVSEYDVNQIRNLPFVYDVKLVKRPAKGTAFSKKLDIETILTDIPPYDRPVTMLNGTALHTSGYNGKGVLIAILDGGFLYGDQINSINHLRARNGIISTYDFVKKTRYVYTSSTHGTAVLSVLAGDIAGIIQGTATGADFILLKTEDVDTEFPCEEDMWAAGAEYADSAGADIISSSLGYYNFDDASMNYKASALDGNTAFVTRAADIAASKGILVVNSAGNERSKEWKRIIFPSDADTVLAAGAVDGYNMISTFSSAGPAYDRRIKPDLSALGVSVPVQMSALTVGRANGTSFSCPVLSGMSACLLQAVPNAKNIEIINALQKSADRYLRPDSLYGYGIPDMVKALDELQNKYLMVPEVRALASPNPSTGEFEIVFREPPGSFKMEIVSSSGRTIFSENYPEWAGRSIRVSELQNREQGIYYIRIKKAASTDVIRIIKLKN
jgi:serine protease AprX